MLRSISLAAFLVAQSSALALHARATVRSSVAAARSAAAVMNDPEATRDAEDETYTANEVYVRGETPDHLKPATEAEADWANAELLARLRAPIRQYDGGWADTATRYGGKKVKNDRGTSTHYGTGGGRRLDDAGAVASDDSTLPEEKQALCVLPEESFSITKMEMSQTDEDFVIECDQSTEGEVTIYVEPMFLTSEDYFYGFTSDSSDKIEIEHGFSSPIEGVMPAKTHTAKKGAPSMSDLKSRIMINVKFKPQFQVGEFDAYLCFIFPNDKTFSKFYKVTGKSTPA